MTPHRHKSFDPFSRNYDLLQVTCACGDRVCDDRFHVPAKHDGEDSIGTAEW